MVQSLREREDPITGGLISELDEAQVFRRRKVSGAQGKVEDYILRRDEGASYFIDVMRRSFPIEFGVVMRLVEPMKARIDVASAKAMERRGLSGAEQCRAVYAILRDQYEATLKSFEEESQVRVTRMPQYYTELVETAKNQFEKELAENNKPPSLFMTSPGCAFGIEVSDVIANVPNMQFRRYPISKWRRAVDSEPRVTPILAIFANKRTLKFYLLVLALAPALARLHPPTNNRDNLNPNFTKSFVIDFEETIHKTEVIKQNLNPVWRPFNIPISKLCTNDYQRPLFIECYDWDQNLIGTVSADFIGKCQTTLQQLLSQPTLTLVDPKKNNKQTGQIIVKQAADVKEHSLLEYIAGGCEISMLVSVDFTGSNGNPASPSSLHYIGNPGQMNQYEAAIRGVGEIATILPPPNY